MKKATKKLREAKLRECWALYHMGTGKFIRAIEDEPDNQMIKTVPVKYVHMREVSPREAQPQRSNRNSIAEI
jgi:hypothetical protein